MLWHIFCHSTSIWWKKGRENIKICIEFLSGHLFWEVKSGVLIWGGTLVNNINPNFSRQNKLNLCNYNWLEGGVHFFFYKKHFPQNPWWNVSYFLTEIHDECFLNVSYFLKTKIIVLRKCFLFLKIENHGILKFLIFWKQISWSLEKNIFVNRNMMSTAIFFSTG